jgi:hypothetical protein
MFFHPDGQYLLTPEEKKEISCGLLEMNDVVAVVTIIARDGDLAFYPTFFSRDMPHGTDMALEYEGSTVCQQRSTLGGSCRAPHETKIKAHHAHRQIPVKVQGRWVAVDRKLARLVWLVNQIPGIASRGSCQGGAPDCKKSKDRSHCTAYLWLSPAQYAWVDWVEYMHRNAFVKTPDPRLADITRRLRAKFEQLTGKPVAVTRATNPFEDSRNKQWRRGVPRLWSRGLWSTFYWGAGQMQEMLASVEDLLREEKAHNEALPHWTTTTMRIRRTP